MCNRPATPLNDAHLAGSFFQPMQRIIFRQVALSVAEQISLLREWGMIIPDRVKAERWLRKVGFHRLSGYWAWFQRRDGSERHTHFRPGTSFESVRMLYAFDRRLRHLLMDALETVEIAARVAISNTMSERYDPHWFLDPRNFAHKLDHGRFLQNVRRDAGISPPDRHKQTDPIRSYLQRYDVPMMPPSWMLFEILSFGALSLLYANLREPDKKEIAAIFGLPRGRFQSWLHSASYLRNLCAHHARIWNRSLSVIPLISKSDRHHVTQPHRLYSHAVALQTLLKSIPGEHGLADRLESVFEEFPDVPIRHMGFPPGWREEEVWGGAGREKPA